MVYLAEIVTWKTARPFSICGASNLPDGSARIIGKVVTKKYFW